MKIPGTIEKAVSALDAGEKLLTATEWERAAIVYAFTEVGKAGRPSKESLKSKRLTMNEFADLGIIGLQTDVSVRRYHERWAAAGDLDIGPGDDVTLPTIKWVKEIRDNSHRVKKMELEALAEHIANRDDVELVAERLAEKKPRETAKGFGAGIGKANRRRDKEHEAAGHTTGTKRHTERATADFLLNAHAAVSQSKLVAAHLENHPDLILTDNERDLIREAHNEIVSLWAAIYLSATPDLISELETQ